MHLPYFSSVQWNSMATKYHRGTTCIHSRDSVPLTTVLGSLYKAKCTHRVRITADFQTLLLSVPSP